MRRHHLLTTAAALRGSELLATACSDDDSGATDAASSPAPAGTTADGTPSGAPLPAGVSALPDKDPDADHATLAEGRYRIPLDETLAFDADFPADSFAHDDGLFVASGPVVLKTEIAGDDYGVPDDPCHGTHVVPAGPTVEDLVAAIRAQRTYRLGPPEQVDLGGGTGVRLDVSFRDAEPGTACTDGVALPSNPDSGVEFGPGYHGHWWILDVDGRRVVVQQNCDCTAERLDQAASIARSIVFTPAS